MSSIVESPVLRKIGAVSTGLVVVVVAVIAFTAVFTRLRYNYQLYRFSASAKGNGEIVQIPQIPYNIPFLGNAMDFLAPKPGLYWSRLFRTHPRSTGACTLLLGGITTHVIFDSTAAQALFKARKPNRDDFNDQVLINGFGISKAQTNEFYGHNEPCPKYDENGKDISAKKRQDEIWHEYLIKSEHVNELSAEFYSRLQHEVDEDDRLAKGLVLEIGITEWLQPFMFRASTAALFGSLILEVYPEVEKDYWPYDEAFMKLFFGFPEAMIRKERQDLNRILSGFEKWHAAAKVRSNNTPLDPNGPTAWDPYYGARVNRARQYFYDERGLTDRSKAAIDLGFLFGLSSNAIPSACWMLMHLLDPKSVGSWHKRVMEEVKTVKKDDGSLDVQKLIGLPVLTAVFHETLRLYTDVLVTRYLPEDLTLPFDNGRNKVEFKKGSTIMAPSFISHRDSHLWDNEFAEAPSDVFYPDRFLKTDPETGATTFSTIGTAGKLFPFGGGKTICPGRVFAKQEVLVAVALVLLKFDIEGLGYLDQDGQPTENFPGLRDTYQGSGILAPSGDMKVRMKRKY